MCLQVGRRPRHPLAHPLSSVAARLRLERRRRRHPPTRQLRLSGRRLLLRPLGRRRLHLRPSRRRRRLHLRPSERRRLLLRPLGWRRLQLHLSGQRRLLLLSVRQVWAAQLARGAKKNLSHRVVRTWQVRRHRPSVLHPHSVAPQHLVLLPHLAARLRLGLHRQHRRLAHPPNSAEHQLSVRARFSAHIFLAPGPRQCVSFCSQVAKVFSAPPKAVVLLPPLQVVAVGLRATLLKRQAVDLGLWRRQAVLHLRRRLGGIAETSQRTKELGGRFRSSMLRPGRRQAFRHRHFGARRTAPSSQQQYKGYTVAREGQPGSGAIATLHGLLSGLVSMHSTQPRLYLR